MNSFNTDQTNYKKRIVVYSIALIVLLVLSLGLQYYFSKTKNHELLYRNAQKSFLEKEKQLMVAMERVKTFLASDAEHSQLVKITRSFRNDFIFLFYQNDTLDCWSSNSVNLPELFSEVSKEKKFFFAGNGYYYKIEDSLGEIKYIGLIKIKNQYPYENHYLQNNFASFTGLPNETLLSESSGQFPLKNQKGEILFYLNFHENIPLTETQISILQVLYLLLFFIVILLLLNAHLEVSRWFKYKNLYVVLFILDIIIFRAILFYFKLPPVLYESQLFSPVLYASSSWLPSLGDLFLNAIVFLFISIVIYRDIPNVKLSKSKDILNFIVCFLVVLFLFWLFKQMFLLIEGIVVNSSFSLQLSNVLLLNKPAILALLIIAIVLFSLFLLTVKVLLLSKPFSSNKILFTFSFVVASAVFLFVFGQNKLHQLVWVVAVGVFIGLTELFLKKEKPEFNVLSIIVFIAFFSLICTFLLNRAINEKERQERILLASNLSTDQDPIAESLFKDIEQKIHKDSYLQRLFQIQPFHEDTIIQYVLRRYFNSYWAKYRFQVTVCSPTDSLLLKPGNEKHNCYDFFDNMVKKTGRMTFSRNLYFLDDKTWENNYLAILSFKRIMNGKEIPVNLYIEITAKYVPKDLGFPDLLIDKSVKINTAIYKYSYVRYYKGEMLDKYGKYYYSANISKYGLFTEKFHFFDLDGYNHLYYKVNQDTELFISKKKNNVLEIISPFSYLMVFFGIFIIIYFIAINFPWKWQKHYNFKNRLRNSFLILILVSLMVVGVTAVFYIRTLHENKNFDALNEKTHSILIELEGKLAGVSIYSPSIQDFLQDFLIKLSKTYFTDINVFDNKGSLIASSRPEIFNEQLIGKKMDPVAFHTFHEGQSTFYLGKENIANLNFLSAYLPLRNAANQIIGYVNLPYFARQNELKSEISTFLTAFFNIYVILIIITVGMVLIVAGYISKPLQLIKSNIQDIRLGTVNAKIHWESRDEIGELIKEYNRMIDELARSAELLAQGERESAWREMAKQVAHEIKNPLTPMKLSVQYLKKAWDEKSPNFDERLERFSQTLIEQIESLSTIASEFSNFAKMPKANNEKLELGSLIYNAVELYKDFGNVKIELEFDSYDTYFVFGDKGLLLRVFNNLIKNAAQAIGDFKTGLIQIGIKKNPNEILVWVKDNGSGISPEQQEKIFVPNFTTKSFGTGLGLAMVKNIIDNMNGKIWFESQPNLGTTFYIKLKSYENH